MKRNILYCVLLLMLMIACGKKGPPMAPIDTTPNSVNDLSLSQKGDMAVLTWTLPTLTVDNTPLADFKEAEVYSFSQSLSTLTSKSSDKDFSLKDILSDKDWKKKFRKKAEKIFTIDKANSKLYFNNKKFSYEADLDLEKNPLNFEKFFSFAVKVAGPDGKKSAWSNIAGIPPWAVARPAQNLKAELKEDEITITWEPPQDNIDGSQPPHVLGYNIYLYSQKDKKTKRMNDKLLLSGPQEWEFSRLTAIDIVQTEEGENVLQLSVDKTTTSSYLYQDLTEEQNLTEMKGKALNIKFEARTLNEEEVHGSIFLDDGINKWGSQNEKEMNLTNQWKEFGYNIPIDEKAIKLTLYIKPTLYPADVTFQIKNVQALLMEGEKSKEEKEKEKIETFLEEMLEEEKKKEEADQEVVEELKEEKEPVNIIRNGDFLLLNENTFSDKHFKFNEHYFYSVRAVCRKWGLTGESSDSQKLEIIPLDTFPPLAPAGLSAITGAGIVSLSWNPNKEKDLFGYKIYRRQEEESAFTVLNNEEPLQKTIFQDDKVTPGKVYIYYITALDNAKPPNESEKSEEIKIRAQ